jgi:hypothetical protein
MVPPIYTTRAAARAHPLQKNDSAIHHSASISPLQSSLSLVSGYSRVNLHFFAAHSAFDAGKAAFTFFSCENFKILYAKKFSKKKFDTDPSRHEYRVNIVHFPNPNSNPQPVK